MDRELTIYYTSDIHGSFLPAKGSKASLSHCMSAMDKTDNCLVMDGGDLLFSSPLSSYMFAHTMDAPEICGKLMSVGGYDCITLGNHDFDYGLDALEHFLASFKGCCLCANLQGLSQVKPWTVVTLANGLRVGITGAITPFVSKLLPQECRNVIHVTEAFPALEAAYKALVSQNVDMTVCIYHGGFERDIENGALLGTSGENQGYEIAQRIGFDSLLCAHQHTAVECAYIGSTHVCQLPEEGECFLKITLRKVEGVVQVHSCFLPPADEPLLAAVELLEPLEQQSDVYLHTPIGELMEPLLPQDPLTMALEGSALADFINTVQLSFSGGNISAASLPNKAFGLEQSVNREQIQRTYPFSNKLKLIQVDRQVLKSALERSAAYFELDEQGQMQISHTFLHPVEQHFNFDYIYGLQVEIDIRKPVGDRVQSIRYEGKELDARQYLKLAVNSFRATGAGGYEVYKDCPVLWQSNIEIGTMLTEYIMEHSPVAVKKQRGLTVRV